MKLDGVINDKVDFCAGTEFGYPCDIIEGKRLNVSILQNISLTRLAELLKCILVRFVSWLKVFFLS